MFKDLLWVPTGAAARAGARPTRYGSAVMHLGCAQSRELLGDVGYRQEYLAWQGGWFNAESL